MTNEQQFEQATIGVVVIGRNEGERLLRALDSVRRRASTVVYVDSGSTDDSVAQARARGVVVVDLDMAIPFTAARARNAGFAALRAAEPNLDFVLFIDGDCEVLDGFVEACAQVLQAEPDVVAVCGYRRERYPERSIYNRVCDVEWRFGVPGDTGAFGGDVLVRASALAAIDGYNPKVIAAEDDEVSIRLRQAGGRIVRLDRESTLHDANMTRFRQWWMRAKRCGHAYAQVSSLHGAPPECYFVSNLRRVWLWGFLFPVLVVLLAAATHGLTLLLLLVYLVRVVRIARSTLARDFSRADSWAWGLSCAFSGFPELFGVLQYYANRLRRRDSRIIEYKGASTPS